jgi:hypothetical protein
MLYKTEYTGVQSADGGMTWAAWYKGELLCGDCSHDEAQAVLMGYLAKLRAETEAAQLSLPRNS